MVKRVNYYTRKKKKKTEENFTILCDILLFLWCIGLVYGNY